MLVKEQVATAVAVAYSMLASMCYACAETLGCLSWFLRWLVRQECLTWVYCPCSSGIYARNACDVHSPCCGSPRNQVRRQWCLLEKMDFEQVAWHLSSSACCRSMCRSVLVSNEEWFTGATFRVVVAYIRQVHIWTGVGEKKRDCLCETVCVCVA